MSISHQSVIRRHSCFKYKNLGGSASIPELLTPGYMPWGGAGDQNIEHTLVILSSFFFVLFCFVLFCFKCILVLLLRRSSGELCYSATALIISAVDKIDMDVKHQSAYFFLFIFSRLWYTHIIRICGCN